MRTLDIIENKLFLLFPSVLNTFYENNWGLIYKRGVRTKLGLKTAYAMEDCRGHGNCNKAFF